MKQNNEFSKQENEKFEKFVEILFQWQKKINLISNFTKKDVWKRHIIDSAQLYPFIQDKKGVLIDVGTGGGFPGIVLSVLNDCRQGNLKIFCVDSSLKKSIFLEYVIKELGLQAQVITNRIENIQMPADIITARAVMSCGELIKKIRGCVKNTTTCLFLKGEHVDEELGGMASFCTVKKFPSETAEKSSIIQIKGICYD